jgi:Na+-translocating ferredoxin:NAD+ oxidoreductase subunit G
VNRAAKSIAVLAIVAALATAGVVAVQQITRARIADGERLAALRALAIVLPADHYDNDPTRDIVTLSADAWTGSARPVTVRRARKAGKPAALVLDVVAPDGYAGPIRLLVSVDAGGRVLGVRVTAHKETAGLGDPIEAAKSDWITRFTGRFLGDPPAERWRVKRDGGDFDQFASATVTPRAVVAAVERALQLIDRHGAELYDAPSGTVVVLVDAPEKSVSP